MLSALRDGFSSVVRNWGLVLVVLGTNLVLALVLAVPLALQLERDLAHTGASGAMMYGFDYEWWSRWSEEQEGPSRTFGPDVLGTGFAYKSLDLLLRGKLPAGAFADAAARDGKEVSTRAAYAPQVVDPIVLGMGALYVLTQVFLFGGLLGVFREPRAGWVVRGFLHGCGFYFGRMVRVGLLALAAAGVLFALNLPLADRVDELAREAVSERSAFLLLLGRHALLFAALLLVHMVASFARVIVVVEERRSALLAVVSSLGFCARHPFAAAGQYAVVVAASVLLVAAWSAFDARFGVTGWKSQLVALGGFQALLLGRIVLRLGLLAGQLELYRARSRRVLEPATAAGPADAVPAAEAA